MFVTTPHHHLLAIDARNGQTAQRLDGLKGKLIKRPFHVFNQRDRRWTTIHSFIAQSYREKIPANNSNSTEKNMDKSILEADYVIIGAGAPSMAIADTLLNESNSTVIMVDRRHKPGGHWNDSYPFVRLHGPSLMYGVNSRPLGEDRIDSIGLNKGLMELASGSEICAYFDDVMRHIFQPTGRFTYLPMHDYLESGESVSLVNGEKVSIKAKKKTFHVMIGGDIPASTPPSFKVDENTTCIPPNGLVNLPGVPECFTIIGGGKTAVDAIVWLLERGANPESITWVRPRDSWFVNRRGLQFHEAFFEQSVGWLAGCRYGSGCLGKDGRRYFSPARTSRLHVEDR